MVERPQNREIQSSPEWLENGVMNPNLTVAFALEQQNLGLTPKMLIAITDPPTSTGISLDSEQIQNYAQNLSGYKEEIGKYLRENSSVIPPFAIIFPTYKEEKNIGPTLQNFASALPQNLTPAGIVVVDSSSDDKTVCEGIKSAKFNFPPNLYHITTITTDIHLARFLGINPEQIKPGKGTNYWIATCFILFQYPEIFENNGWIWIIDTDVQYPPYLYWNMLLAMLHFNSESHIGMIRANLLRLTKGGNPKGPWKQGGRVTKEIRRWVGEELLSTVPDENRKQILQQLVRLYQPLTGFYGIRARALAQMNLPYNYALETSTNLQILNQGFKIAHPFMGIHAQVGAPDNVLFSHEGMGNQIKVLLKHYAQTGQTSPEGIGIYSPPLEVLTSPGLI